MVEDDPLLVGVRDWLDKHGYRLEMTTARTLMRLSPMLIDQGSQYVDPTTGVLRETDVMATWAVSDDEGSWHHVHLVVECKNTTAPWIAFIGEEQQVAVSVGTGFQDSCSLCDEVGTAMMTALNELVEQAAYAVVEKRNPEKGGRDHARAALLSVASATVALRKSTTENQEQEASAQDGADHHRMDLILSLVTTTSPLVTCRLDASGSFELDTVPLLRTDVTPDGIEWPTSVVVCHRDQFEALASGLIERLVAVRPEGMVGVASRR